MAQACLNELGPKTSHQSNLTPAGTARQEFSFWVRDRYEKLTRARNTTRHLSIGNRYVIRRIGYSVGPGRAEREPLTVALVMIRMVPGIQTQNPNQETRMEVIDED